MFVWVSQPHIRVKFLSICFFAATAAAVVVEGEVRAHPLERKNSCGWFQQGNEWKVKKYNWPH